MDLNGKVTEMDLFPIHQSEVKLPLKCNERSTKVPQLLGQYSFYPLFTGLVIQQAGLGKLIFPRKLANFHIICYVFSVQKDKISLQIPKLSSKYQHFPQISLPYYPFSPAMATGAHSFSFLFQTTSSSVLRLACSQQDQILVVEFHFVVIMLLMMLGTSQGLTIYYLFWGGGGYHSPLHTYPIC